jgi:hypothetical protein
MEDIFISVVGTQRTFQSCIPTMAPNKSSLFILLLGVIRRLELKPISEQKVENIYVAPPYCQTACWLLGLLRFGLFVCVQ